jgi:UDP-N-acetylmuramoyl-tripeptide--D-alanyl-D-alanine ligase
MELNQIHELYLSCSAISTDTRNIETGAMFFALKGPSFNGNKYALNAIDKGAKFAIVDEVSVPLNDKIIQVDDVLTTLQDLARFHREYFFNRK